MKIKITRGVMFERKPLEVGKVYDIQGGMAAMFIAQNQAVEAQASPEKGDVDASKSEEKSEEKAAKAPKKAAKKKK